MILQKLSFILCACILSCTAACSSTQSQGKGLKEIEQHANGIKKSKNSSRPESESNQLGDNMQSSRNQSGLEIGLDDLQEQNAESPLQKNNSLSEPQIGELNPSLSDFPEQDSSFQNHGNQQKSTKSNLISVQRASSPNDPDAKIEAYKLDNSGTPSTYSNNRSKLVSIESLKPEKEKQPSIREPKLQMQSQNQISNSLSQLQERYINELKAIAEKEDSELTDGERLRKQQAEIRLMALQFLQPGESLDSYSTLLDSLANSFNSGATHSLLRAATYEVLDMKSKRNDALLDFTTLEQGTFTSEIQNSNNTRSSNMNRLGHDRSSTDSRLEVDSFTLCYHPSNKKYSNYRFSAGRRISFTANLLHLSYVKGTKENWQLNVSCMIQLLDQNGKRVGNRLYPQDKDVFKIERATKTQVIVFKDQYEFDMRLSPGKYTIVLIATDENTDDRVVAQQSLQIEIQ